LPSLFFTCLHFTIRSIFPEYNDLKTTVGSPDGSEIHDVYSMILAGIPGGCHFWLLCILHVFLCRHLAHGVSSMFQSLGLRSESWRCKLDLAASAYGWIIFIGFSIIPVLVLAQKYG
jgi:succinate dehydrogenase / fumarate reductase cytochrome b subunit